MKKIADKVQAHIRWLLRRDVPDVMDIERASFGEVAWSEEDFLRCLRQKNCIGQVADIGEVVVGYVIYELKKSSLHVLNFAVHPGYRRRGIGQHLVDKLTGKLASHRRTRITLEIRESNLDGCLFFRSEGFEATRVIRGYYDGDTGEDAYRMVYRIAAEPPGEDDS